MDRPNSVLKDIPIAGADNGGSASDQAVLHLEKPAHMIPTSAYAHNGRAKLASLEEKQFYWRLLGTR